MHLFGGFRTIWLATSISVSSFWLADTYFWSYFSWLAKSGRQNLWLAGNTFPPFPSFWSHVHNPPQVLYKLTLRWNSNECVRPYFVQLERLSSFIQIKWIKHALAHSVELHIRANFYSTSGGYEDYTYHYIILNNGILKSNSSIFPQSEGYITHYTP